MNLGMRRNNDYVVGIEISPITAEQGFSDENPLTKHLGELRILAKQIAWGHAAPRHLFGLAFDKETGQITINAEDGFQGVGKQPAARCEFPTILRQAGILDEAIKIGNLTGIMTQERAEMFAQLYVDNHDRICQLFEEFVYTVLENAYLATERNLSDPKTITSIIENKKGKGPEPAQVEKPVFTMFAQSVKAGYKKQQIYIFDWQSSYPSEKVGHLDAACEEWILLNGPLENGADLTREQSWRSSVRKAQSPPNIPGHKSLQFVPHGVVVKGDLSLNNLEPLIIETVDDVRNMLANPARDNGTVFKIDPETNNSLNRGSMAVAQEMGAGLQYQITRIENNLGR